MTPAYPARIDAIRSACERMADHHFNDFQRVITLEAAMPTSDFDTKMSEWMRWAELILDSMIHTFKISGRDRLALDLRLKQFLATVEDTAPKLTPTT